MISVFLDESGINPDERLCIVAGFSGTAPQWSSFCEDWKRSLGCRTKFHMVELRWRHPRTAKLLARLGPLPDKHGLRRVIGGVWWKDYEQIVKPLVKDVFARPYMLAFMAAIHGVLIASPGDEKIAFVLENQPHFQEAVSFMHSAVFDVMKYDSRVIGLSFIPKDADIRIQASDYLAFQIREDMSVSNSRKADLGASILGDRLADGDVWDSKKLSEYAQEIVKSGTLVPPEMFTRKRAASESL